MFHAAGSGFAILGSGFVMTGSAILGTALLIGLVWLIWKGILWIRSKVGGKKKAGSAEKAAAAKEDVAQGDAAEEFRYGAEADGATESSRGCAETGDAGFHLLEEKEADSDEK